MSPLTNGKARATDHLLTDLYKQILGHLLRVGEHPNIAGRKGIAEWIQMTVYGLQLWALVTKSKDKREVLDQPPVEDPESLVQLDELDQRDQDIHERHETARGRGRSEHDARHRRRKSTSSAPGPSGFKTHRSRTGHQDVTSRAKDLVTVLRADLGNILKILPRFMEIHDDAHLPGHLISVAMDLVFAVKDLFNHHRNINKVLGRKESKDSGYNSFEKALSELSGSRSRAGSAVPSGPSRSRSNGGINVSPKPSRTRSRAGTYVQSEVEVDGRIRVDASHSDIHDRVRSSRGSSLPGRRMQYLRRGGGMVVVEGLRTPHSTFIFRDRTRHRDVNVHQHDRPQERSHHEHCSRRRSYREGRPPTGPSYTGKSEEPSESGERLHEEPKRRRRRRHRHRHHERDEAPRDGESFPRCVVS